MVSIITHNTVAPASVELGACCSTLSEVLVYTIVLSLVATHMTLFGAQGQGINEEQVDTQAIGKSTLQ